MRQITSYIKYSPLLSERIDLAVVTDLHNGDFQYILPALDHSDAILIAGDIVNRHRPGTENALAFLKAASSVAPTFFSLGNHERYNERDVLAVLDAIKAYHIALLDDRTEKYQSITIGGLSSVSNVRPRRAPDPGVLKALSQCHGFRLLLCHHPEYYYKTIKPYGIDLTVSGHAHGGQIRIGRRGAYAPGQGLFPRLVGGWYDDGRLLVSRGATNSSGCPRWGNPCEAILLRLEPGETDGFEGDGSGAPV